MPYPRRRPRPYLPPQRLPIRRHRHRAHLQQLLLQKPNPQQRPRTLLPPLLIPQRLKPHRNPLLIPPPVQRRHLPRKIRRRKLQPRQQQPRLPPHRPRPPDNRPRIIMRPQQHRILPILRQPPPLRRHHIPMPIHLLAGNDKGHFSIHFLPGLLTAAANPAGHPGRQPGAAGQPAMPLPQQRRRTPPPPIIIQRRQQLLPLPRPFPKTVRPIQQTFTSKSILILTPPQQKETDPLRGLSRATEPGIHSTVTRPVPSSTR